MGITRRLTGACRLATDVLRDPDVRRSWTLRLTRPPNLFQPHNDTAPDRYPGVFGFIRGAIPDGPEARLLSFGCSTGDEVFSLRSYFPQSTITGIDISRANIAVCRRRSRRDGDGRMRFVRAGTASGEAPGTYDAVLAMAVFRHGDLARTVPVSCRPRITFSAFDRTVVELADCLRTGGYLAIEHSNFRFADTSVARRFEVVWSRDPEPGEPSTPRYGRDDRLLDVQEYRDVIFLKVD